MPPTRRQAAHAIVTYMAVGAVNTFAADRTSPFYSFEGWSQPQPLTLVLDRISEISITLGERRVRFTPAELMDALVQS